MALETAVDLAAFFDSDAFAVAATYTPAGGGAPQSVDVIFDATAPKESAGDGELAVVKRRRLLVRRAQCDTAPAKGSTWLVAGVSYRARAVEAWREDPTNQVDDVTLELTA